MDKKQMKTEKERYESPLMKEHAISCSERIMQDSYDGYNPRGVGENFDFSEE